MARPNPIRAMMATPLPPKTIQRRMPYRPDLEEVEYTYYILNKYAFDNALKQPCIILKPIHDAWGLCQSLAIRNPGYKSWCEIKMSDKWYCLQWMVTTLAHEMCHQYQWDIYGPIREDEGKDWLMSHGPTFLEHRDRLAEYHVPLKTCHSRRKWFIYQDLFLS